MDHLGGADATFLYTETAETPMHVGSLNVYELPTGYKGDFVADVRSHIGGRLHLAPVFRRRLLDMCLESASMRIVASQFIALLVERVGRSIRDERDPFEHFGLSVDQLQPPRPNVLSVLGQLSERERAVRPFSELELLQAAPAL